MKKIYNVIVKKVINIKVLNKKTNEVIPYINNPRKNDHAVDKVAGSIAEFGFKVPIVIDKDNIVVTGHTRLKAAKKLNMKEVPCVIADDLTEAQIKAFRIADNRVAEESEWDMELLSLELEGLDDFDIDILGFDDKELDQITQDDKEVIEDDFDEEPPENPISNRGDIWLLGRHRLMCGDSTSDDVEVLMDGKKANCAITDPPYNTGMVASPDSTRLSHMFNDSFTDEEWQTLLSGFTKKMNDALDENTTAYVFLDWRRSHELIPHLKNNFKLSNLIIWDKVVHGLGSDYKYTHEFIHVCKKGKPKLTTHQGEKEYSDVWHIQRKVGRDKDHATKKPLELCARPMRHATLTNNIVLDVFGGSGSTLIAAEQLNRICYMMELDEKYIDVIVNRYINFKESDEDVFLIRDGQKYNYNEVLELFKCD